jgi:hypothetical protein
MQKSAQLLKDTSDLAARALVAGDEITSTTLFRMAESSRFVGTILRDLEAWSDDVSRRDSARLNQRG